MLSPGGKWRVEWRAEAARSKNGKSRHTSNPMSKDEAHPQSQPQPQLESGPQPDESRQPSHPSQAATSALESDTNINTQT